MSHTTQGSDTWFDATIACLHASGVLWTAARRHSRLQSPPLGVGFYGWVDISMTWNSFSGSPGQIGCHSQGTPCLSWGVHTHVTGIPVVLGMKRKTWSWWHLRCKKSRLQCLWQKAHRSFCPCTISQGVIFPWSQIILLQAGWAFCPACFCFRCLNARPAARLLV